MSKTEIPCTNSRFKAVILRELSANKLEATKELKAINSTSNCSSSVNVE